MEARSIGSRPSTQEAVSPFTSTVIVCNLAVDFVAGWLVFGPNVSDEITTTSALLKSDAADSGGSSDASLGSGLERSCLAIATGPVSFTFVTPRAALRAGAFCAAFRFEKR